MKNIQLVPIALSGHPERANLELPDEAKAICSQLPSYYDRMDYFPPWIWYLAVEESTVLGTCAFKTPPRDNKVEIAYYTFGKNVGQGVATLMVTKLIEIAQKKKPGIIVYAQTLPKENASTKVLTKLNFTHIGMVKHPTDGDVWEWHLLPIA
ncbi:MAG: GNAT family N-acetyltransferase [Oligoflexia bacterium]|nr:GNAT family N-acetyltransferase [Oligoflexia bacterium]